MVKPAQAHPKPTRKLPSAPSKTRSNPSSPQSTVKTTPKPFHLQNTANPPHPLHPFQTSPTYSKFQIHAKPTPNPPAILSPFKTWSNPLQTHVHNSVAGNIALSKIFFFIERMATSHSGCTRSNIFAVQSPSLKKQLTGQHCQNEAQLQATGFSGPQNRTFPE